MKNPQKMADSIDRSRLLDTYYSVMKVLQFLFIPLFSVCFFAPSAWADEKETPLTEAMGDMNGYFKKIRKTEDMAEGAKLAREAQGTAIKSLTFIPMITLSQSLI